MQRLVIRLAAVAAAVLTVVWVAQTADAEATSIDMETYANPGVQELSCSAGEGAEDRPSPLKQLRFSYDGGEGLLCYGAPSARGRDVIGGLVPFGSPWRAGANEPTTFHLSAATSIGGVSLEAGSYSFYVIPGESEWELMLNTNTDRWGIPINADVRSTEVGSFTAAAGSTDAMVETLTYSNADGAIVLEWENTRISIPIG
ncbi:MAG: DUF2911 domain-containing protein [Gemmatimonadota bacterium]|nr:DUF2911 domain-containing protein [Gemmatimonadota bacterium]